MDSGIMVIGITGGTGSGKSTVSNFLREEGYPVVDADLIAHQITETGSPVLDELSEAFGYDIICEDGSLNRGLLAERAFVNDKRRAVLEKIVTDRVASLCQKKIEEEKQKEGTTLIFLDAPLLFESGTDSLVDRVWFVTADIEVRIARVMKRDEISRQAVLDRIRNQMSDDEKAERSDVLIDNSGSRQELIDRVRKEL